MRGVDGLAVLVMDLVRSLLGWWVCDSLPVLISVTGVDCVGDMAHFKVGCRYLAKIIGMGDVGAYAPRGRDD